MTFLIKVDLDPGFCLFGIFGVDVTAMLGCPGADGICGLSHILLLALLTGDDIDDTGSTTVEMM